MSQTALPTFTVGDRLRKARELTGMDQKDFAAALGMSRNTVSNYEVGNTPPKRMALNAWALATGIPVEWLLTGQAADPSPDGPVTDWYRSQIPRPVSGREPRVTKKPAHVSVSGGASNPEFASLLCAA